MIPEEEYGLLSSQISDNEQEEAIEFISYAESDDDDEDPYFMPQHNKRTSTWTFQKLTCAPIQVVRFTIPAVCVLTIFIYTIVIAVMTEKKKKDN
ncbi:hypothetical protein G6F56_007885 [Rhizopus delemar]|uniref:Uncharacterized protein n=1 Tax=Rhizopus stolonifer TaxID=4846 RepID=A0A367J817_RHIST|nr:hypothetical protein G6F56_007885 [Rhizopus delemar]RCH86102.1 hypothetical protein CU098_006591 [Rhizopus stolonifer]